MTAPKKIIPIGACAGPGETGTPARVVAGNPVTTLWNDYSDPTGRFHTGIWACTPGKWAVSYAEEEVCTFLEGRARLTNEAGESWEFGAGDSFAIPAGFTGFWETLETLRKVYVIYEPPVA